MSDLQRWSIGVGSKGLYKRRDENGDWVVCSQVVEVIEWLQQRNAELERDVDLTKCQCDSYRHERTAIGIHNEQLQHHNESLTRTAETLLAVLKRGDDPAAAMYQLEEVLSDAP